MSDERRTSTEEAKRVGDQIGVDWDRFDLEQFRAGMDVEYEHGSRDPQTDVTGDDPVITGKIALAHMKEFPTTTNAWSGWDGKPRQTGRRGATRAIRPDPAPRTIGHRRYWPDDVAGKR